MNKIIFKLLAWKYFYTYSKRFGMKSFKEFYSNDFRDISFIRLVMSKPDQRLWKEAMV